MHSLRKKKYVFIYGNLFVSQCVHFAMAYYILLGDGAHYALRYQQQIQQ